MNTLKNIFTIVVLAAFMMSSCSKNDDALIPQQEILDYDDILGFYESNGVQKQDFTLDATTGGTFTGEDGTKITFPPNSLVDGDGNLISGTVDVAIKEIFKASQMILSNKPTNAINFSDENTFLLSEGETEVVVTQNGNSLDMAPGTFYQVQVPSAGGEDNDMLPFAGTATNDGGIVWNATRDGASGNSASGIVYNAAPSSYIYDVFETGWSNCDKFYAYPGAKTTNYINLTNSPNATETAVYLIFEENNLPAVVKIFNAGTPIIQSYTDSLPVGLEVTYVVITIENNQQYLATKSVVISEEEELSFTFEPKTTQEILDALALLD
ncbi:hypothetical protein ATE84_3677 [Aquimarina sp. MAR_2010_214]|uniref:hypothetical protein n=1 Tax=Aquimarina sp. MAR_2010_214 TaxID=1250026 RepID=UPI000C714868|nr:hypothetical protein [Aquimarina sp. MAR_2010_214]PKV51588.1 hypothetical protein ATE84_3677 [Aquimarina sp. MAR_2010_214]